MQNNCSKTCEKEKNSIVEDKKGLQFLGGVLYYMRIMRNSANNKLKYDGGCHRE